MSRRIGGGGTSGCGYIQIIPEDPGVCAKARRLLPGEAMTIERYRWVGPPDWSDDLPEGFAFELRCVTTDEGRRCFPTSSGVLGYLANGFAGGLAVLHHTRGLSGEQCFAYRLQWLFFQRTRASREHLRSTLEDVASLRLRRSSRGIEDRNSILPESIGQDARGEGRPWSLDGMLDRGRKAARAQGLLNPRGVDCVRNGLLVAARRNPLWLAPDQVPPLIKMALYDPAGLPRPGPEAPAEIIRRALDAMESHMRDHQAAFDRWFWGRNNSFVKQLAQQKRAPGGAMDRALVRRALLEQGWLAYQQVADCVDAMLDHFRGLLPEPLNAFENRLFERVHRKQPCFGGLPSLMLAERFPLLYPILEEVWAESNNQEAVAVMHRLLQYYEEMAPRRREGDRRAHGKRAGALHGDRTPVEVPLSPDGDVEEGLHRPACRTSLSDLEDLAEALCRDLGITCGCDNPRWILERDEDGDIQDRVRLTLYCQNCPAREGVVVPLARLRELAGAEG
jgi:hypothetical protein